MSQSGRVRAVTAITGGSGQRETSPPPAPSAAAGADVTLLVAFATVSGAAAEFGMTLMCHLDLDARSVPASGQRGADVFTIVRVPRPRPRPRACTLAVGVGVWCWWLGGWSARLAFREQKNGAPFSVIPQERASLEGMVQQKLGHCGC